MSSAVSLVPTLQKTTKKRRPTFRPGGGQRKKTKNGSKSPSTTKQNGMVDIRTERECAALTKSVQIVNGELPRNSPVANSVSVEEKSNPCQEPRPMQSLLKQSTKHAGSKKRKVTIAEPGKSAASSEVRGVKRSKKRRSKSKGIKLVEKVSISSNSRAQTMKSGDPHSNDQEKSISDEDSTKEENATAAKPNSLASFCSKFVGPFRPRNKTNEAQPLPPPLPPAEDQAPSGPQVKVVNGEIVIQESSIMDPTTHKTVQEVEEEYEQVVEEEGQTGIIQTTYSSFTSRRKPQHWTVEETKKFYNCLRQVGTDFVSMEAFFVNRPRKSLKKKYQSELTRNQRLIELALDPRNKIEIDLSVFNVDKDSIVVVPSNENEIAAVDPSSSIKEKDKNTRVSTKKIQDNSSIDYKCQDGSQVSKEQDGTEQIEEKSQPMVKDSFNGIFSNVENNNQQQKDDDIFGELGALPEHDQMEEFTLEQEMAVDSTTDSIPLPLIASTKVKSKRPKFRAGKRKTK